MLIYYSNDFTVCTHIRLLVVYLKLVQCCSLYLNTTGANFFKKTRNEILIHATVF